MSGKYCCDEMHEFMKSVGAAYRDDSEPISGTRVFVNEDDVLDEILVGAKNHLIPNLVFRFCPYCGTVLQKTEIKKDDSLVGRLSTIVFDGNLDDPKASLQSKLCALQEAVAQVRTVLKSLVASGKPAGLFKVS